MKSLAVLEYMFIFDPDDAFRSGSEFEKALAEFFGAHGLDASIIETRGGSTRRILLITRTDDLTDVKAPKEPVQKAAKFTLDQSIKSFKK